MKVSFDYDETLSRSDIQVFAKELISEGYEVWIVTMRFETQDKLITYNNENNESIDWNGNDDLFRTAKELGIPEERIVFMNWQWKSEFLKGKDFIWHLDDCSDTLKNIRENCPGLRAVNSWKNPRWKEQCLRAVARKEKAAEHG